MAVIRNGAADTRRTWSYARSCMATGFLVAVLATLAWVAVAQRRQTPTVPGLQEIELGHVPVLRFWNGEERAVDKLGWHYAQTVQGRGGWRVWLEGYTGPAYTLAGSVAFSSDGGHVAYGARRGDDRFVVVDGREGPRYRVAGPPALSADGRHLALQAAEEAGGEGFGQEFVVMDGHEGSRYATVGNLVLSEEGQHLAYVASRGSYQVGKATDETMKECVVVDGREGPQYDYIVSRSLALSSDGRHVAYLATKHEGATRRQFVVLDGQEGPQYDYCNDTSMLAMSSTGQRVAYEAWKGEKCVVVVDGQEGPEYDEVDEAAPDGVTHSRLGPVFSVDGKRLAYMACKGRQAEAKWFAVVDGREEPSYRRTWAPRFSMDGRHVAYSAEAPYGDTGPREFVMVDGQPGPRYSRVKIAAFSLDGKHVAYAAKKGDDWLVVLDDRESPPYCEIVENGPSFHPDGTLEFLAMKESALLAKTLYRVTWSPKT